MFPGAGYTTKAGSGVKVYRIIDIIMSINDIIISIMIISELVRCRHSLGWSQRELAERSGLSRTEISAIETSRVVPSTAAALSLARVLECSVEELFSLAEMGLEDAKWAWEPNHPTSRFWQSRIGGKVLLFPTEWTPSNTVCHH